MSCFQTNQSDVLQIDKQLPSDTFDGMAHVLEQYPELLQATTEQKLELIDELWECVRRENEIAIQANHLTELDRRLDAVRNDPSLALDPSTARGLLKQR